MKLIVERAYTFVTNNRLDFLALYSKPGLHAGLVILVPNVAPVLQGELFGAALHYLDDHSPVNAAIEIKYQGDKIEIREYAWPGQ